MFCKNCGKIIPDNATFCDGCGQPINYYQQPQQRPQQPPYQPIPQQPYQPMPPQPSFADAEKIGSMHTLGLVGLLVGIFVSRLVGLICGAIALGKLNSMPMYFRDFPKWREAKKLSVAAVVVPIVLALIIFLIYVFVVAVLGYGAWALSGI